MGQLERRAEAISGEFNSQAAESTSLSLARLRTAENLVVCGARHFLGSLARPLLSRSLTAGHHTALVQVSRMVNNLN
jgi:hypothetical protein